MDDYEGIHGFEQYRGDLGLMYFARLGPLTGELIDLRMFPTRIGDFRVNRAGREETDWLRYALEHEGGPLGNAVTTGADGSLVLQWESRPDRASFGCPETLERRR